MNPREARLTETAAMLMIGDGVLGTLRPSAHCLIWRAGDGRWSAAVDWFAAHPGLVRAMAVTELAAGIWLARRQYEAAIDGRAAPLSAVA